MEPEKPRNLDPVAWAEWNAHTARALSMRLEVYELPEVSIEEIAEEVSAFPCPLSALEVAIHRACSELEGQGEKSDRIANQLLTALAIFHKEMET